MRCVLACLWSAVALVAQEAPVVEAREVRDLAYVDGDAAQREHHLDLYLPAVERPPLVMFIHGGTWSVGNKDGFAGIGRTMADAGVACAVVDFRKFPAVRHPTFVEDCARAFAWLVEHAEDYGCDPDEIFVMGHSSGAHLASLLALDPSYLEAHDLGIDRIRGVLAISGIYDVRLNVVVLVDIFGEDHRVRRAASPLDRVDEDAPPFLLLWAETEFPGLGWSAQAMHGQMLRKKARVVAAELPARTHATILTSMGTARDETTAHLIEFIERVQRGWDEADPDEADPGDEEPPPTKGR